MIETAAFTCTTLDFLRHGEVEGVTCFRGTTDDPLSVQGWQQMQRQCAGGRWQKIISSPLRRCAEFAASWAEEHRLEVVFEPDWREIHFGEWEGLRAEQIDSESLWRFYDNPSEFTPPKAESYAAFGKRIQLAWDRLLVDHAGQQVLVVTHAGVIRHLFVQLLGIPIQQSLKIEVPHACQTRFSCFESVSGRFVQFNFHKPV